MFILISTFKADLNLILRTLQMPAALLPDWLISRRHCKKDFQHALDDIRAKIRNAIEDMPPNEDIKSILSESCRCFIFDTISFLLFEFLS